MNQPQSLAAYFAGWAADRPARIAVAATTEALAAAAIEMADLVGQGALAGPLGRATGKRGEVDEQKEIDLLANNRIVDRFAWCAGCRGRLRGDGRAAAAG